MGWTIQKAKGFDPRIGVMYQVDDKTVIRAGYGRSFDTGVFGSIFGHVVTQNLPVLANQSVSCIHHDRYGVYAGSRSAGIRIPDGPVQRSAAGAGVCWSARRLVPTRSISRRSTHGT